VALEELAAAAERQRLMNPDVPQVSALLTISGVTIVTIILVEVVKGALDLASEAVTRWGRCSRSASRASSRSSPSSSCRARP
jgi:hypothetical protein